VLRSRYDFDRYRIGALFEAMLKSENFVFDDRARVVRTLDAFFHGLDFADAFHVSALAPGETFVTFDRDLVKLANKHIHHASIELAS